MGYYEFPHTRNYDSDLGFLIKKYKELGNDYNTLVQIYETIKLYIANIDKTIAEKTEEEVLELLQQWLDDGTLKQLINEILNTKTVKIPSDYPTIQLAINSLYPFLKNTDTEIEILIESNHKITAGYVLGNGDYSRFTISSQDEIVYLAENFENDFSNIPAYIEEDLGESDDSLFLCYNGNAPIHNFLLDANHTHKTGLYMFNSNFVVTPDHGILNSGLRGVEIRSSHGILRKSKWSGAYDSGVRLQNGSTCMGAGIIADNCCSNTDLMHSSIYISKGSVANIREGSAQNSGKYGLIVRRSRADCEQMNFSGAQLSGVLVEGASQVSLNGGTVNNCGLMGLDIGYGSVVRGPLYAQNNHSRDLYIRSGAFLDASSTYTTTGERPGQSNANVIFNNISTNGIIIGGTNSPPTFQYTTVDNYNIIAIGNGMFIGMYSQIVNLDEPLTANSSLIVSMPDLPANYNVINSQCNISLRESANFSGAYILTQQNLCLPNAVEITNTGKTPTGRQNVQALSYRINFTIFGRNS